MDREIENQISGEEAGQSDRSASGGPTADLEASTPDLDTTAQVELEPEPLTQEVIEQLKTELDEANQRADENLEGWQRSLADFSNYKKRIDREQTLAYQQISAKIIRKYLEISDDLERALKNRPEEGEGAAWSKGIDLIYQKLQGFLQAEGIMTMEAERKQFDPNLHEAIAQEDNDEYESGQIIEVVQNGYLMGDRVIRPAIVRVAR